MTQHGTNPDVHDDDRWALSDIWLSLLFVLAGGLITAFVFITSAGPFWWFIGLAGWVVGPLLLLLGIVGVVRSVLRR